MRRRLRLLPVALALCALCALGGPAQADAPAARLRAVLDGSEPQREEALAWWDALSASEQVATLRAALAGGDAEAARIAAACIGYPYLDAGEVRRAQSLLHDRAAWTLAPPRVLGPLRRMNRVGFGAGEVVPFFRAAALDTSIEGPDTLTSSHRGLRTEHVVELAPLLAQGTAGVFEDLLWIVGQIGEFDRRDVRRREVARGLVYGLRRLRTERAGLARPRWEDVRAEVASAPGGGLPAAYVEIAEASFPASRTGFLAGGKHGDTLSVEPPLHWLRRWTLDLRPGPEDAPLLRRLVELVLSDASSHPFGPAHLLWALRGLADLPAHRAVVAAWAGDSNERACFAATVMAERGAPEEFGRLLTLADAGELPRDAADAIPDLLWLAFREEARRRAAERVARADPQDLGRRDGLDAESRLWMERGQAIHVDEADLEAIEAELWKREVSPWTLLSWHARIRPGRLTAERAAALLEGLRRAAPTTGEDPSLATYDPALAELELVQPEATRAVLVTWLETQRALRGDLAVRLAKLGVTGHDDALCAAWPQAYDLEAWALGRVRSEAVRAFLWQETAAPDAETALRALEALMVQAGVPGEATRGLDALLYRDEGAEPSTPAVLDAARDRLRDGDVVGALLAVAGPAGAIVPLGHVADARVHAWLRARQARRDEGTWWRATSALALAGDEPARAALGLVLADDRTSILDQFEACDPGGGRDLADELLERLDSNCCLAWAACEQLRRTYPTLPFDAGYGGAGTVRTRAWIASFRWRQSPLLEGWVPTRP